jgi:hypothetical protein
MTDGAEPQGCRDRPSGAGILRNRVYIGDVVHKGKSYPGEHEPIVDRGTWDRVHEDLTTNAKRRGN